MLDPPQPSSKSDWCAMFSAFARGALAALAALAVADPAGAVTITEFRFAGVPTGPTSIARGPDGNIWFAQPDVKMIGRITPDGGLSQTSGGPGGITGTLRDLAGGADGTIWFTEVIAGVGAIKRISTAGTLAADYTGLSGGQPDAITAGPDGNMWFTDMVGSTLRVGRITRFADVDVFTSGISTNTGPGTITAGPDGNLWFTEFLRSRVGRITPGGTVTEFTAGITPNAGIGSIVAGPDGNVWFRNNGWLARITPTGVVTELPRPSGAPSVNRIATGPDGYIWWTSNDAIGRRSPDGRIREFRLGISPGSGLGDIVAGADGSLWFTETTGNRIGRIRLDPPTPATQGATGIGTATATATGTVDPRSEPTTWYFEFGPTAAYGHRTPTRSAGDGEGPVVVTAPLSGLADSTTYHYRLVATNVAGTARGVDRALTTLVNRDRDGDRFARPGDCDDADPREHPGGVDIPRNGLDEDCRGGDADYPLLPSRIVGNLRAHGTYDSFRNLHVQEAIKGSRVRLRCLRRCDYKVKRVAVRRDARRFSLKRRVRHLKLPRGSVFEVRITRRATIGVVRRWDFKSLANPKPIDLCIRPKGRPRRCRR
jgi:streptogramin lyase